MSRLRFSLSTLLCAVLLLADAGWAQYWQGRARVDLKVSGARSGAVSGAEVTLTFLESGSEPGPAALSTDGKGMVTLTGLAEGQWRVRIDHPDFFSYVTIVVVQIGKKVEVIEAAHEASATGSGLLRARFGKVSSGVAPPERIRTRESTPPPAPRVRTPPQTVPSEAVHPTESKPAEDPPAPSTPNEPVADATPTQTPSTFARPSEPTPTPTAEPTPVPAPEPQPVAEIRAEPAPETESRQEAESGPQDEAKPEAETTKPPIEEPDVAPAVPTPKPVPAPEAEPEPDVETVAPAAETPEPTRPEEVSNGPQSAPEVLPALEPLPAAVVRSWDRGTCHDCRPGESALSIDATAASGSGACPEGAEATIRSLAQSIGEVNSSALRHFYGPLTGSSVEPATAHLPPVLATEINEALAPFEGGSCRVLVAYLPAAARFTGYRYEARDFAAGGDCLPDQTCPIGEARWLDNPGIVRGDGFTLIWATFSNRSADRVRHPRLSVYFQ